MRTPVLTLIFALSASALASALGPVLPLASPPPGTNAASSTIFDAMLAISRAAAQNPRAAQAAAFPYAAAIQQYNTGDFDRARASAVQAIAQSNGPQLPQPTNAPPSVSPPPQAIMPAVQSADQADMEQRLALARRALTECGPTTGDVFVQARATYDDAVRDELASNYRALTAAVQSIVDACAVVPPQQQASR